MNLPNKITVFRMAMIPAFVAVMLTDLVPYNNYIAGVIFIIAAKGLSFTMKFIASVGSDIF